MQRSVEGQDDALTVARWLPGSTPAHALNAEPELGIPATFDPHSWEAHDNARFGVRDAEQVVLARGLAEQYGRALTSEIRWEGPELPAPSTPAAIHFGWYAQIATAPLASRLRALARVARENPEAR